VNDGEQVSCDVLVIKYPPSVLEIPDGFPAIDVKHGIVIAVNQTPWTGYSGTPDPVYDIVACDHEVQRVFGKRPSWAPISPVVRNVFHQHHADAVDRIVLADDDWVEIIDPSEWQRPKVQHQDGKIHIGRHARDSEWKWPATKEAILAAYPDDPNVVVEILGGAEVPRKILGTLPNNWVVYEFGSMEPADFLARLDEFVYFPHPHMEEAFGRTILEAMAAGVPCRFDPRFASTFGGGSSPSAIDRFGYDAHRARLAHYAGKN
jgi:hypothetical protein